MKLLKSMMINCKKAAELVSKKEAGVLSVGEWVSLYIHVSMCSVCKTFEKQSAFIVKHVKKIQSQKTLTNDEKIKMNDSLEHK